MVQGTLPEVRDRSGTFSEVRDWSEDPPGGLRRVGVPLGRFATGWWTLPNFRDGLGEIFRSPERVGGPFWRSWTGQRTLS